MRTTPVAYVFRVPALCEVRKKGWRAHFVFTAREFKSVGPPEPGMTDYQRIEGQFSRTVIRIRVSEETAICPRFCK